MTYEFPPHQLTSSGRRRRVGVEFEFAGLSGQAAADAIVSAVGGRVHEENAHRFTVEGSELGSVKIELDTQYVHPSSCGPEPQLLEAARKALGDVAQSVVPYEVVTPPVPLEDLHKLDPITEALRGAGARGTSANPVYAFGMHLNPESHAAAPSFLLPILQAFVVMNAELRADIRPDASRELLGWAEPFAQSYNRKILEEAYQPDRRTLIKDYIEANPGRNYDLDMLPLFADAESELVESLAGPLLSNPRPAFHYRLPDCRIDQAGWSAAADWNRWVRVERLAHDTKRLSAAREAYLRS